MQTYFGGATIGEVGRMFSKINADGDEKMTWEEWCTAVGADAAKDGLTAAMATPEGRAEFKKVFESLDANGDGALSSKEWGQGIGKKWHEDDAFKELMKKYFGGATIGEVASQFNKINADGDAKLTWDEWCTAVGASAADAELDAAAARIQGAAVADKIQAVREELAQAGAQLMVVSALDEV